MDEKNTDDVGSSTNISRVPGNNFAFIGLMGSGKSLVSRAFSNMCGLGFIDTDQCIEQKMRLKVSEIFKKHGENSFREKENKLLKSISSISNHVISLGGGSLIHEGNLSIVRDFANIIWLNPPMSQIVNNFLKSKDEIAKRPFLSDLANIDDKQRLQSELVNRLSVLFSQRVKNYESADIVVTDLQSNEVATAGTILQLLNEKHNFSIPMNNWANRIQL